jgi:hypothetical protein
MIEPAVRSGRHVWFSGHWGFQWYAERAGARPISRTGPFPEPGDLVVSNATDLCTSVRLIPRRTLLRSLVVGGPGGRVMSSADQAGFFSSGTGYLPWSWGSGDINRFDLWKVEGEPDGQTGGH